MDPPVGDFQTEHMDRSLSNPADSHPGRKHKAGSNSLKSQHRLEHTRFQPNKRSISSTFDTEMGRSQFSMICLKREQKDGNSKRRNVKATMHRQACGRSTKNEKRRKENERGRRNYGRGVCVRVCISVCVGGREVLSWKREEEKKRMSEREKERKEGRKECGGEDRRR